MKLKNIVRIIILAPLAIYLLYCFCHAIANKARPTYTDCGRVVSKSNDEVAIKYGTRTELYLNVQFDKSGFRSIECGPTLYFSKHIGDNVCFDLKEKTSLWYDINHIVGTLLLVILVLSTFVALVIYLLPNSWFE